MLRNFAISAITLCCCVSAATHAQDVDVNEMFASHLEMLNKLQASIARETVTKTRTITTYSSEIKTRIENRCVAVKRTQVYYRRVGILRQRLVKCYRTVISNEIRKVAIQYTVQVPQTSTQNYSEIVNRYTKSLTLDPLYRAVNGPNRNGDTIDLSPLPTAAEPTYDRMAEYFISGPERASFTSPQKINEQSLGVASKWISESPTADRKSQYFVAATPVGNRVVLTVIGQQVVASADTKNLTANDYIMADDQLISLSNALAEKIETYFTMK